MNLIICSRRLHTSQCKGKNTHEMERRVCRKSPQSCLSWELKHFNASRTFAWRVVTQANQWRAYWYVWLYQKMFFYSFNFLLYFIAINLKRVTQCKYSLYFGVKNVWNILVFQHLISKVPYFQDSVWFFLLFSFYHICLLYYVYCILYLCLLY